MPKATKKSIKVRLLHAEKTGAAAVENAEDLHSLCPLCNKEVDDSDYRRELDCDSAMCPPRLYHEDCITNHLSKHRFMRDRNNGFRCPAVLSNHKPCPAYVYKVHIMQPQNKKKKEKKLEALLEAPPPRPPKPPPAPAKAPAAATVVTGVTAGTKGTAQAKPTVLKVINSNAPIPVRQLAAAKAAAAGPGARIHASNTPSDIPGLDPAVKRNAELRAMAAKLRAEIPANNSKAGGKADPGTGGMAGAVKGAGGEGAAWGKGPTAAQRAAAAGVGSGGGGGGDGWEVVRRGHKAVAHGEHHGNVAERAFDAHGAFAMGASDFPALMAAEPPDRHTPITDLSYDDDEAEIANFDNGHPYLTDTEQQQPDSAFGSESDAAFAGEAAVLYDTPGPAVEAVLYDIVYSAEDGSALVLNDVLQMYVRPEDVYGNDLLTVECAGDDGNTYTCVAVTEAQMKRRSEWVVQQLALQEQQELEQQRQQQEQEQQEQAAREEAERREQERLRLEQEQQERLRLEQEQRERERQELLRRQQEAEAAAAAAAAAFAAQQQRQREEEERQRRQVQLQREQQAAAAAAEAQQRAAEATAAAAAAAEAQRRAQEAAQLASAPQQHPVLQAPFSMPQPAAPAMLPYTLSGPHPPLPPYHVQHQHTTAQLQPPLPPYLMAQQQQHPLFPHQQQPQAVQAAAAAAAMPHLQGVPVFPGAAAAPAPVPRPQPAPSPLPIPVPVPQPVPVSAQPGAFPYHQQQYHHHAVGGQQQQQQQVVAEEEQEDDEVSSLMQLLCT